MGLALLVVSTVAFWPAFRGSSGISQAIDQLPAPVIQAFGLESFGMAAGYLRGGLYELVIPLLFAAAGIMFANSSIAAEEDAGRLELFLAQPVSRTAFLAGRSLAVFGWLLVLTVVMLASQLASDAVFGLQIETARVAATVVLCALLGMFHAGLCVAVAGAAARPGRLLSVGFSFAYAGYLVRALFPLSDVLAPWRHVSPWDWALGTVHEWIAAEGPVPGRDVTPGCKDVAEREQGADEIAGIREAEADRQQPPGAGSRARNGDAETSMEHAEQGTQHDRRGDPRGLDLEPEHGVRGELGGKHHDREDEEPAEHREAPPCEERRARNGLGQEQLQPPGVLLGSDGAVGKHDARRREEEGYDEFIQAAAQVARRHPEALQAEGLDHWRRKLVDGLAGARRPPERRPEGDRAHDQQREPHAPAKAGAPGRAEGTEDKLDPAAAHDAAS